MTTKTLYLVLSASFLSLLAALSGCGIKETDSRHDGTYTAAHISNISITEPETALALLDTAEQQGLMNDFDLNRLRAVVYHNGLSDNNRSLEYALKAYNSPSAHDNGGKLLLLIQMIADQYYLNGDYARSVEFCTKGIKIAQDSLFRSAEANLRFNLGRNLLFLNREEEGFRYCYKAVDILDEESEKDDTWETSDDYVYTLAILIGTLRNEGHYDKAAALLPRYEAAVSRLETKEQIPDGLVDMRKASGYGMAAHLYAILGEKDKAHGQYLKLCSTEYSKTPDAGQLTIPYLVETGNYREALRCLNEEKRYWQANTDTVSYIQNHLETELMVYEELGDIRAANRLLHTIQTLNDTLRLRDRNERALELAEIYKTNEQALQIERQSVSILVRNVVIVSAVLFLLLAALFMARILRFNRIVSTKNRSLVKTINELMGYKDKVFELQEEIIRLQEKEASPSDAEKSLVPSSTCPLVNSSSPVDKKSPSPEPSDLDRLLFERMDHEVMARRLFLNPDFSKAFLLAEFPVPDYKFSNLFKLYTGCTFSQYVHNCRLDHAVKLMNEHPSWSLDAIAKAVLMSNGSFYHQFKRKFGMSPSEYRNDESRLSPEEE